MRIVTALWVAAVTVGIAMVAGATGLASAQGRGLEASGGRHRGACRDEDLDGKVVRVLQVVSATELQVAHRGRPIDVRTRDLACSPDAKGRAVTLAEGRMVTLRTGDDCVRRQPVLAQVTLADGSSYAAAMAASPHCSQPQRDDDDHVDDHDDVDNVARYPTRAPAPEAAASPPRDPAPIPADEPLPAAARLELLAPFRPDLTFDEVPELCRQAHGIWQTAQRSCQLPGARTFAFQSAGDGTLRSVSVTTKAAPGRDHDMRPRLRQLLGDPAQPVDPRMMRWTFAGWAIRLQDHGYRQVLTVSRR